MLLDNVLLTQGFYVKWKVLYIGSVYKHLLNSSTWIEFQVISLTPAHRFNFQFKCFSSLDDFLFSEGAAAKLKQNYFVL
jgi:hypothetical protein